MSFLEESGNDQLMESFVEHVRKMILNCVSDASLSEAQAQHFRSLATGKMLRTKFAARIFAASGGSCTPAAGLEKACAAIELVHTASLLHDDIIDNALVRRSQPTLWKTQGANYAVLAGDLLYCEALTMLLSGENGYLAPLFVEKVKEVCLAEIRQELLFRARTTECQTYLDMVRGKTGPLFAFLGYACGAEDAELARALEEAGYLTGIAYQLADDLLDVVGDEESTGKTLGTDALRKKATLAFGIQGLNGTPDSLIMSTIGSAKTVLERWPLLRDGITEFFVCDLGPVLKKTIAFRKVTSEAAA
jgi:heptaprenyl diphosphate synthase